MKNLINKTAIVSGSSQGIGKETALLLASRGASVVLLARNEEKLRNVLSELSVGQENQKHDFLVADFSKPNELNAVIQKYIAQKMALFIFLSIIRGAPREV